MKAALLPGVPLVVALLMAADQGKSVQKGELLFSATGQTNQGMGEKRISIRMEQARNTQCCRSLLLLAQGADKLCSSHSNLVI